MLTKIIGKINEKGEYILLNDKENGWTTETINETGEIDNTFKEESNTEYTKKFLEEK